MCKCVGSGILKVTKDNFQDREEMGIYCSLLGTLTMVFNQFETRRKYTLKPWLPSRECTHLASGMILETQKDVDWEVGLILWPSIPQRGNRMWTWGELAETDFALYISGALGDVLGVSEEKRELSALRGC